MAAGDPIFWSDVDYAINKPMVRLLQQAAQTGIASGSNTAMTFGTGSEEIDTHGFHNTSSNTSRITPTIAGYYRFHGGIAWTGNTDYTVLQAFLRLSGLTGIPPATRVAGITASSQTQVVQCDAIIACNGSTDYVELVGAHVRSGAGTSATVLSSQFTTVFECEYLRPL